MLCSLKQYLQGFDADSTVVVEDIGDGNLNDVARLIATDELGNRKASIIVKQSMPYVKVLIILMVFVLMQFQSYMTIN